MKLEVCGFGLFENPPSRRFIVIFTLGPKESNKKVLHNPRKMAIFGLCVKIQARRLKLFFTPDQEKPASLYLCLREIWFLTARYDIDIYARHVAGVDNSIADHLSRWHLSLVHHTRFAALTADTPTEHVLCSPHLFLFEIGC